MESARLLFLLSWILAACLTGTNSNGRLRVPPVNRSLRKPKVYEVQFDTKRSLVQKERPFAPRAPAPDAGQPAQRKDEDLEPLTEYIASNLHNISDRESDSIQLSTYRPVPIASLTYLSDKPAYRNSNAPRKSSRTRKPVYNPASANYPRNISAILQPMSMFYGMVVNKRKNRPAYENEDHDDIEEEPVVPSLSQLPTRPKTGGVLSPTPLFKPTLYKGPTTRVSNGREMGSFASREREEADPFQASRKPPALLRYKASQLSASNTALGEDNIVPEYKALHSTPDPVQISQQRPSLAIPEKDNDPRFAVIGQYLRVPKEYLTQASSANSIPGESGVDYPVYEVPPPTSFLCASQSYPGYYADVEAQCQVFHICQADGRAHAFICPDGTVFNQQFFVCDWWYNVECEQAPSYYLLNAQLFGSG